MNILEIQKKISPIFQKYNVKSVGIFGSYARGDARPDSDVDFLVSFGDARISLWDLSALTDELSESLGKPVDVVSDRAIVPYFKDYIYRDLKTIYG